MVALLLVPTIATPITNCSLVAAERIQPTPILDSKKTCKSKLKYQSLALHNMIYQCFQHLNQNSINMFGAPMIPMFGFSQCACITDKIRTNYECAEDYMKSVESGEVGEILGEYSKECIIEGAMGEAARQAYLGATDNATKSKPNYDVPNDTSTKEPKKENKNPVTWDDLINK
jgi:hypothetical protein